eukprot:2550091-Heterocapsa_arctica.AAC.1
MAAGMMMRSRLVSVWRWRAKFSVLPSAARPGGSQKSASAWLAARASWRRSRARRCCAMVVAAGGMLAARPAAHPLAREGRATARPGRRPGGRPAGRPASRSGSCGRLGQVTA